MCKTQALSNPPVQILSPPSSYAMQYQPPAHALYQQEQQRNYGNPAPMNYHHPSLQHGSSVGEVELSRYLNTTGNSLDSSNNHRRAGSYSDSATTQEANIDSRRSAGSTKNSPKM